MYDTTVQGVLQVHITCVLLQTMNRFVSGSKLVTFHFKLFPYLSENLICYYCYIFFFLHFVVHIFIIHCVPQTRVKATVIVVNCVVTLWTACKNTKSYKWSRSFLTCFLHDFLFLIGLGCNSLQILIETFVTCILFSIGSFKKCVKYKF